MNASLTRRVAGAAVAVALALPVVVTGQAQASAWPNDTWDVTDKFAAGVSVGAITWGNRTSNLRGYVEDFGGVNSTTVVFTAYAGATKVDSDTRTASPGENVPFNFPIGDPDKVGGFDRLKIQVCQSQNPEQTCNPGVNVTRDAIPEREVWRP
ncbi:hypothetical protein GCM10011609_71720 [Lentzea pudingi]|uniref:Neocarzinostatin family protein n=1 Tax=Lentzea pudingi TaxID=1789439 RepID=A0ABQ2IM99_9PSEU|nr:hypothetical protein [Lentzea pudingi]GGN20194.1 hypothetical protein GCM10011609_71720 [Lentzea pudingi]